MTNAPALRRNPVGRRPRVIPAALVMLANLGRPRRPSRAPARSAEPELPDPVTASGQLEGLARRLIEELASLDPTRLRRCAREQCGLIVL
jgi:hypothetical protein